MNTVRQTGIVPIKSSPTVTLGMVRNNNPDLKWETKTTFNIGADLGFFANRLMLTAEYYYSKTSDMLYAYEVPVPPTTPCWQTSVPCQPEDLSWGCLCSQ